MIRGRPAEAEPPAWSCICWGANAPHVAGIAGCEQQEIPAPTGPEPRTDAAVGCGCWHHKHGTENCPVARPSRTDAAVGR